MDCSVLKLLDSHIATWLQASLRNSGHLNLTSDTCLYELENLRNEEKGLYKFLFTFIEQLQSLKVNIMHLGLPIIQLGFQQDKL